MCVHVLVCAQRGFFFFFFLSLALRFVLRLASFCCCVARVRVQKKGCAVRSQRFFSSAGARHTHCKSKQASKQAHANSINQSINQPTNQSINKSINQSINQSIGQEEDESRRSRTRAGTQNIPIWTMMSIGLSEQASTLIRTLSELASSTGRLALADTENLSAP
jgi:hypothetical protein